MPKPSAEDRLGRLLAIVPWVAAHDGPQVTEVCRRFKVGEKELLEDLDLLFMCGIHPFTPDVLIDVDVADGRVWIRMADYFRRPLRLSPQEGLALVSAGSALLSVPGADPDGALATALTKLENVLGVGADDSVDIELAQVAPSVLHAVRQAVDGHRKVELDYYSFGRDGHSTRVVQPWRVFNHSSQWYLAGWCERAGAERLFRVDRISRADLLTAVFDPPMRRSASATDGVYHPGADDPRVVLDLEPPVHWIAEQYPNEGVELVSPAVLRVSLRTSQRAWMERLLLRGGPYVRVVSGDASVGAAAARLLARYRP
jgi:proteasome accessory factor C